MQIRWHGRGGQGAVTAARLLGYAAVVVEGKYAQSFPAFGTERRGAPVMAFTRISPQPIRLRSQIYVPDVVVILDAGLVTTVDVKGLRSQGHVIINATGIPDDWVLPPEVRVTVVDATRIALDVLGVPIVNTTMAGVLAAATGLVRLEAVSCAIRELFPPRLADRNILAAEAGYCQVRPCLPGEGVVGRG